MSFSLCTNTFFMGHSVQVLYAMEGWVSSSTCNGGMGFQFHMQWREEPSIIILLTFTLSNFSPSVLLSV